MKLTVRTGAIEVTEDSRVSLVLDPSESARDCRSEMMRLVGGLISELPVRVSVDLYFVGSPKRYDGRLLSRSAQKWFAENDGRASIMAPTLEAIGPDSGSVVIVGSGPIFDLADRPDWEVTLVSLGTSMLTGDALCPEWFSPSAGELLRLVHDPVAEVGVTGPGFLPIAWDSPGLRLEHSDGVFTLAGPVGVGRSSVSYAALGEQMPCVSVLHESGRLEVRDLPGSDVSLPLPHGVLTDAETRIFLSAVAHERIRCPLCGDSHQWDTVRCAEVGVILGEPVYLSIGDVQPGAVVTFDYSGDGVEFRVNRQGNVLADDGCAIAHGRSGPQLYRLDAVRALWESAGESVQQYYPLSEGRCAVFL